MPAIGDWEALERAEQKLEEEERAARAAERKAREQYAEAMLAAEGRLDRLARQRKFLKKRGAEMLRRGLKSMDELEEAEAREAAEREKQAASAVRPPTPPSAGDSSEFPLVDEPLPDFGDSFWADLGFANGSFEVAQGSGG
jgi:multidrug efflux pump subunit AcrA (membrane-fusion protein)